MQIHELNNFSGTLGSGAYLAVDDGNDTGKLSTQQLLAATEARIDNIIAGPAPSAEEIVDARLGDDGVTYPSLGDAIRDQFSDVKSDLSGVNSDFQCRKTIIKNAFITSGGVISDADTYDMVCFEVIPETTIQSVQMLTDTSIVYGWFTSQPVKNSVAYDNSRTIVSGSTLSNLVVPSGCHWIAFRVGSNNDAEITPRAMSWDLLQKRVQFVTPEQFGAVGDGTTDDTTAFTKALATGLPVIATGNYLIGFLQLSGAIYGFGKGYIKCENIRILPNAVLDGLTIENTDAEGNILQVNTTNNASNGVYYNASVTNCTLICAEDSIAIYFYLYNGKGAMNVFFRDIIVKSTDNGFAVINLHTNQSESSRPWMASIVFENIVCIESPFQYFIHCDKPVGAGASSNLPFYKAVFSGCQFQYVDEVTQYCAFIRGFKNTLFNIITYDFPSNKAIYWLDENEQSIAITELPLSHSNLYSAVKGISGYVNNIASVENRYYLKAQLANRAEVYDSFTENGSYFAYAMPVIYPVGFTDDVTQHKINGVAIPQSSAVGNSAEGSVIFGYDNDLQEPIFRVYTNGNWKKYKILVEEL